MSFAAPSLKIGAKALRSPEDFIRNSSRKFASGKEGQEPVNPLATPQQKCSWSTEMQRYRLQPFIASSFERGAVKA
jgi:hypothetical protein